MENEFKDYVTSSAFNLSLSKNMITYLLILLYWERDDTREVARLALWYVAEDACRRRGLCKRIPLPPEQDPTKDNSGTYSVLTEEGGMVCSLLIKAGFNLEHLGLSFEELKPVPTQFENMV